MSVGKLSSNGTLKTMKSREANDCIDTSIRQTVEKDIFLPFSWPRDSSMQWFQLLHSLDRPGMSLLTSVKVQMQKCEKCSREFCSSYNRRRHTRGHRRSVKFSKEPQKNRELLAAFWDKLSLEKKAKDVISLNGVTLKGLSGAAVIKALASALCNQGGGIWGLPQVYVKAGSTLLDIVHAKPSELSISSKELFNVLDDASERTFLCGGTADLVEQYVFDGEEAQNCLELKNVISTAGFVFEKQLVKAWFDEKDAEALRCQKLLVDEEEAEQRRQAVLLERKRQKKLRQKEQKLREQLNKRVGDLSAEADSVDAPALAQEAAPPSFSDSISDSPDLSANLDSKADSVDAPALAQEAAPPSFSDSVSDSPDLSANLDPKADSVDAPALAQEAAPPSFSDSVSDSPDLSVNLDPKADSVNTPALAQESAPPSFSDSISNSPDLSVNLDSKADSVNTPALAQESAPPSFSDSISDSQGLSVNLDSRSESQSKEPADNTEARVGFSCNHIDQESSQISGLKVVSTNEHRRPAPVPQYAIRFQRDRRFGFRANHRNVSKPEPVNKLAPSTQKVWAKKLKVAGDKESLNLNSSPSVPVEDTPRHQEEENNFELMIGSISIPLKKSGMSKQQDKGIASKPQDTCNSEHPVLMNNSSGKLVKTTNGHTHQSGDTETEKKNSEKLMKTTLSGSSRGGSKLWRPVSRGETKSTLLPIDKENKGLVSGPTVEKVQETIQSSDESSMQLHSNNDDSSLHQGKNDLSVPDERNLPFSSAAVKEFLARRWEEAVASKHVVLVLSPRPEQSQDQGEPKDLTSTENKLGRKSQSNYRRKTQKNSKMKYIPKQKAVA